MAAKKKAKKKAAPKSRAKSAATSKARTSAAAIKMPIRRQPQSFRARSIQPALTVNDLARSVAFYRDGLGFMTHEEWKDDGKLMGVELRAGNAALFLSQDDGAKGWDRKKGIGLSLTFVTAQRVDEVADRVKKAGYPLLSEPADLPWRARAFRVADPDGFVIGISS